MSIDGTNKTNPYENIGLTRPEDKKERVDEMGQDQFLELMMAQLQNQDPMNPMESGDFLGQIAQFSTVNGIKDLNESFSQLTESMASNQALQASSMIGRTVLAPSEIGVFEPDSGGIGGSIDLPSSTTNLNITIYDTAGQVVKQIPMGQQPAGTLYFAWDGTAEDGTAMPPGEYQIKAEAMLDGEATAVETMVASRVESVSIGKGGQGITLNVVGLGPMSLSDVREIM